MACALFQYYKKAVEVLKKLGLVGGNTNPCFYVQKSEMGVLYVALYMDDNLMVGDVEAIDEALAVVKETGWC